MRTALWMGLFSIAIGGCASAHDDNDDQAIDEAALSARARPYVGEFIEVTQADVAGPATSMRLRSSGTYSVVTAGGAESGRFTVGKGRKVLKPDFAHAYENRTVEVEEDLLRLSGASGSSTELFVGTTYLRDAVMASPTDGSPAKFFKRLRASACTQSTCSNHMMEDCVDVVAQSGNTRAICLERYGWRVGSGD